MILGMKSNAVNNQTVATMEELDVYAYQAAETAGIMLLILLDADMDWARIAELCKHPFHTMPFPPSTAFPLPPSSMILLRFCLVVDCWNVGLLVMGLRC